MVLPVVGVALCLINPVQCSLLHFYPVRTTQPDWLAVADMVFVLHTRTSATWSRLFVCCPWEPTGWRGLTLVSRLAIARCLARPGCIFKRAVTMNFLAWSRAAQPSITHRTALLVPGAKPNQLAFPHRGLRRRAARASTTCRRNYYWWVCKSAPNLRDWM